MVIGVELLAAARHLGKGSRHGRSVVESRRNTAHARVHGNRAVARFKGILESSFQAEGVVGAIRRVGGVGRGLLGHGAKVFGSALYDQRALESERREAADPVAIFIASLKLLGEEATLESKGVER